MGALRPHPVYSEPRDREVPLGGRGDGQAEELHSWNCGEAPGDIDKCDRQRK